MSNNKIDIFASLMCADQLKIREEILALEEAGIDGFHLDIMDGIFVPNITLGFPILHAIRKATHLPLDVHLMLKEPERFIQRFAEGGADIISFHYESASHIEKTLKNFGNNRVKKALAINPSTDIENMYPYLSGIDIALVMSVEPGFAGRDFIPASSERVRNLDKEREKNNLKFRIEVDGNINTKTITSLTRAGARIFVGGSTGLFVRGKTFSEAILDLRRAASNG